MSFHGMIRFRILKVYGVSIDRYESITNGFDKDAEALCALLSVSVPSGTLNEFAKLTGADPEKVLDIGNKAFASVQEARKAK